MTEQDGHGYENRNANHGSPGLIDFSVIVPFLDNVSTLETAVLSIYDQAKTGISFEILLADNGSADGSTALARQLIASAPVSTRLLDASQQPGAAHARNLALKAARGQWVAHVDADDWVSPGWLSALARRRQSNHVLVAMVSREWDGQLGKRAPSRDPGLIRLAPTFVVTTGIHVAVERDLLKRVGGWNVRMGAAEDHDLLLRLQLAGAVLDSVNEAVYHYSRVNSPLQMMRKGWNYARADLQLFHCYLPLLGAIQPRIQPRSWLEFACLIVWLFIKATALTICTRHAVPFLMFGKQVSYGMHTLLTPSTAERLMQYSQRGVALRPMIDAQTWDFWRPRIAADLLLLTIEGGPVPGITDRLLDLLSESKQQATFFLVGNRAQAHPGLVRRILAEGHEIGNHMRHSEPMNKLNAIDVHGDIEWTQQLLIRLAGINAAPRWFKPPSGVLTGEGQLALLKLGLLAISYPSINNVQYCVKTKRHLHVELLHEPAHIVSVREGWHANQRPNSCKNARVPSDSVEMVRLILIAASRARKTCRTLTQAMAPFVHVDTGEMIKRLSPVTQE